MTASPHDSFAARQFHRETFSPQTVSPQTVSPWTVSPGTVSPRTVSPLTVSPHDSFAASSLTWTLPEIDFVDVSDDFEQKKKL